MANYNSLKNAGLTKPSANVSLGSDTSRYTDIFLSGNVNIAGTSLTSTNAVTPRIASIAYVGDDTAAAPAGGQTITLNGSGFVSSFVYVGGTIVASVSVVNSTQLTFVAPAKTAGSYSLNVVNSDGASATFIPGMQYSGIPAWSTASGSIGSVASAGSANLTVAATSDSTVSYSITSGSLPSGLSLNASTGAITGNAPSVGSTTTYNFTVRATDSENQDTDRNFSITITSSITIEYLVVAGGGNAGGSTASEGGGGGGGTATSASFVVTPGTPYTVTVGATRQSSVFGSVTTSPGTSGTPRAYPRDYGGSAGNSGNGFTGGGAGNANGNGMAAGGGGATSNGGSAGSWAGWGGLGLTSTITGETVRYARGGYGGGGNSGGSVVNYEAQYGQGGDEGYNRTGAAGVVILAYPDSASAIATIPGTLTYTVSTATRAGYRVYTFTAGTGLITF
jgi:hypothetical protein